MDVLTVGWLVDQENKALKGRIALLEAKKVIPDRCSPLRVKNLCLDVGPDPLSPVSTLYLSADGKETDGKEMADSMLGYSNKHGDRSV
jgi:hypothetical protein